MFIFYLREEQTTISNNGEVQDDKEENVMKTRSLKPPSPIMMRRQSVFEDISQGIPRAMTRLNFL